MNTAPKNEPFNIVYDEELHWELAFEPNNRIPENDRALEEAANNPRQLNQELMDYLATLPKPLFPVTDFYTRENLKRMNMGEAQNLYAYQNLLCAQRQGDSTLCIAYHIAATRHPKEPRPLAKDNQSLACLAPTVEERELEHGIGYSREQILAYTGPFTLRETSAGDVVFQTRTSNFNPLIDLEQSFQKAQAMRAVPLKDNWERMSRRPITTVPGLLSGMLKTAAQPLNTRTLTITWPKAFIDTYLSP